MNQPQYPPPGSVPPGSVPTGPVPTGPEPTGPPAPGGQPVVGGYGAPAGYGAPSGYGAPIGYGAPTPPPRRSAGRVAALVVAAVLILALLASTVTFGVLWGGANGRAASAASAKNDLAALQAAQADDAKAKDLAAKYAAGASTFDYRNLGPWRTALVQGVSPELKTKLDSTAGAMNQLLQPLQWVSTGTVLDAVVTSRSGTVFTVNTYVKVVSTNSQAAGTREVLTLYTITLDKSKDWQITDVGGIGPGK